MGWDEAVTRAAEVYRGRMYNLFCDNCHSHVVTALNYCAYDGKQSISILQISYGIFCGTYGKSFVVTNLLVFFILI